MDPLSACQPCEYVVGGRSDWNNVPRVPQWFARVGDPAGDLTVPAQVDLGTQWKPDNRYVPNGERCATRLWRLTSSVRERQRSGGPFSPLTRPEIVRPPAAGQSASDRTMAFRLRLDLTGEGPDRSLLVDPGQPLEFYAQTCSVALLGPTGAQQVDGQYTIAQQSGFVVDTLIGVRLIACEEAIGAVSALYSQMIAVPALAETIVPVPAGATEVVVYASAGDNAPTVPWRQTYGNPVLPGFWIPGAIEFHATLRQSLGGQLLPGVTHLVTDAVASERQFAIVWTIRP